MEVQVSVTPSTGDRWDLKYVFLDLIITINKLEYPDVNPPTFKLNRVRGISQEHQEKLVTYIDFMFPEMSPLKSVSELSKCINHSFM